MSLMEDRFHRARLIDWMDMDSVLGSRCLVVGAGALGNEVVKNLALAGVGGLTLLDMDHVEISNLNRCVFFREWEEGRPKAEVVADRSSDLSPTEVEPVVSRVEDLPESAWSEYDLVFGCLDNIAARLHANGHAYQAGVPYIDGGTHGMFGKVQVVIPPCTPCLQCGLNRSHFRVLERRYSCTGGEHTFYEPRVPAEVTTTSVIAALQVREGLKILSGAEDRCLRHVLYYHGLEGGTETLAPDFDPQGALRLGNR